MFTVGSAMRHLHAALPKDRRGIHVEQADKLVPILASELSAGDTILIKGSLGSAMGQVVDALLEEGRVGLEEGRAGQASVGGRG